MEYCTGSEWSGGERLLAGGGKLREIGKQFVKKCALYIKI
jgi:hypothetical protein